MDPEKLKNLSAKEIRQRWTAVKKNDNEDEQEGDMKK